MRFASLLLAILQLGVLIAAPVADAHLEAQQVGQGVQLEAENEGGGYDHDHLACQLCRTLDSGAHPFDGLASSMRSGPTLVTAGLDLAHCADASPVGRSGSVGPRAPPCV